MAILPIRRFGDPALRQVAGPVERVQEIHRRLAEDMLETMRAAPGVGLAAPQVGVLERIFVWEVEDEHGVVVNPKITSHSDETEEAEEGCLSLPGIYYAVERPAQVRVEGTDLDGNPVVLEADELLARVCQHEIDHLDGVLFIDRLSDDRRRDALEQLRDQALGLAVPAPRPPAEDQL